MNVLKRSKIKEASSKPTVKSLDQLFGYDSGDIVVAASTPACLPIISMAISRYPMAKANRNADATMTR